MRCVGFPAPGGSHCGKTALMLRSQSTKPAVSLMDADSFRLRPGLPESAIPSFVRQSPDLRCRYPGRAGERADALILIPVFIGDPSWDTPPRRKPSRCTRNRKHPGFPLPSPGSNRTSPHSHDRFCAKNVRKAETRFALILCGLPALQKSGFVPDFVPKFPQYSSPCLTFCATRIKNARTPFRIRTILVYCAERGNKGDDSGKSDDPSRKSGF